MDVLLIGGTGVLSGAVTNEAVKRGIDVTVINRGNRTLPDGVKLIKSDRSDFSYIASQLKDRKFDAVIDFLCYKEQELKESFSLYHNYTNQYFFISSGAVYDTSKGGICKEDAPKVLPIWPYSANKWAAECLLREMAGKVKCNYTIIRPCVTYGDTRIPYGIYPPYGYHWTFCARALARKPLVRWNEGVNRCNMMRVEDFAVGVVGLIGNKAAYNEAFNICGDETPSFNDVLKCLEHELDCDIPVVDVTSQFYANEIPLKAGEILGGRSIDAIVSNERIKSVVPEFRQTITLQEGIAKTIRAYKSQNYQKGIDWKFDADCDRIIIKWCKQHKMKTTGMNLKFIDYLKNASVANRLEYELEFYKNTVPAKLIVVIMKICRKIVRFFK